MHGDNFVVIFSANVVSERSAARSPATPTFHTSVNGPVPRSIYEKFGKKIDICILYK